MKLPSVSTISLFIGGTIGWFSIYIFTGDYTNLKIPVFWVAYVVWMGLILLIDHLLLQKYVMPWFDKKFPTGRK